MSDKASLLEFVELYNNQQGWTGVPLIHQQFCEFLESNMDCDHKIVYAFRYSGKSHIVSSLYVAWRLYLNPMYTAIIVSAEKTLANERSRFIRDVLETHPLTSDLVPKDKSIVWRTNNFTVNRPRKRLEPSVVVTSMESHIAGKHCDELIGDDIETEKNSETEEQREDVRNKFLQFFSVSNQITLVGTPHHEDSIYATIESDHADFMWHTQNPYITDPDMKWIYDRDFENSYAGEPIWEERFGIEQLQKIMSNVTSSYFMAQYMLTPSRTTESMLEPKMLKKFGGELVTGEHDWEHDIHGNLYQQQFIDNKSVKKITSYWDTALGTKWRNKAVLCVVALTHTNDIYILENYTLASATRDEEGHVNFDNQMLEVLNLMKRTTCKEVYIEDNFDKSLPGIFKTFAKDAGFKVTVNASTRTSSQNKKALISNTLEPIMSTGRLYAPDKVLNNRIFITELRDHPKSKTDDHIDALTGAIIELPGFKNASKNKNPLKGLGINRFKSGSLNNFR